MSISDDIKLRLGKKNVESLNVLAQQNEQSLIDSTKQARIDSIAFEQARRDSILKHLKTHQTLKDLENLDSQFKENQPMSSVYLNPEYQEQSENAIYDLLTNMIVHEAQTNITDDYGRYNTLREDLINIHSPYQKVYSGGSTDTGYGMGIETMEDIPPSDISTRPDLITIGKYFSGPNNIDRMWPSDTKKFKEPTSFESNLDLTFNINRYLEEGPYYRTENHDFRSATVARMVASDQEIRDLILGRADLNEETQKWEVSGGLVSLIDSYNLTGESNMWKWMKETFGLQDIYRSNTMKIIDVALKAKKMGRDYFTDPGGFMTENKAIMGKFYNVSGMSREMLERLSAYPEEQQVIIRKSLQEAVDLVYSKGLEIEKHANELVDRFEAYQKQFPSKKGVSKMLDMPSENKDLVLSEQYKKDLQGSISAYKSISGKDFDVYEALNNISLTQLNEELDKLPDEERTDAIDQYLINLTQVGGAPAE
ncbi:MAG: hypothetical protein Tp152DCM46671_25 [Prokaryotic dsDNA virus sp.]|nr:MAG: hypothetical protein Tp152DCM46671_25 [Prokaryotic dsDNA virus sp.]|tara:strand:- start:21864 stop:23306 length:1443 start_codon:yes stop_codon:yes gene_type:complete